MSERIAVNNAVSEQLRLKLQAKRNSETVVAAQVMAHMQATFDRGNRNSKPKFGFCEVNKCTIQAIKVCRCQVSRGNKEKCGRHVCETHSNHGSHATMSWKKALSNPATVLAATESASSSASVVGSESVSVQPNVSIGSNDSIVPTASAPTISSTNKRRSNTSVNTSALSSSSKPRRKRVAWK